MGQESHAVGSEWGRAPGPGQRQGRAWSQGRTLETQSSHWAAGRGQAEQLIGSSIQHRRGWGVVVLRNQPRQDRWGSARAAAAESESHGWVVACLIEPTGVPPGTGCEETEE